MGTWINILIILSTILILCTRFLGGEKIQYLIKFWNIHRYFIFKSGHTIPIFNNLNILMFFLRIILFSIFISLYILPKKFAEIPLNNFYIICLLLLTYIGLKFIIEKTLAIIFSYNLLLNEINRYRIGFKNLIAFHLYFYLLLIIFNPFPYNSVLSISLILFINYILFSSYYIYKKTINKTFKSLIYFILYLCTFEIAPALFLFWYAFKF
ncbi:MAG: hypothetical protein CMC38_02825 [Flavobacteriaceae bacterium]|nr:hypothetical protein [Flavobacteriaceae bacterium]